MAEFRPIHQLRYLPIVGQYVDHHSANIRRSTVISRSTYRPSVDRYVDRHSTDMSTDTSVKSRLICRPIYRLRGAQNTHDPLCFGSGPVHFIYIPVPKGVAVSWHYDTGQVFEILTFSGKTLMMWTTVLGRKHS